MMRHGISEERWRTSSYSADNAGQCVETQPVEGTGMAVRDSKAPTRGISVFPSHGWSRFIAGIKEGTL